MRVCCLYNVPDLCVKEGGGRREGGRREEGKKKEEGRREELRREEGREGGGRRKGGMRDQNSIYRHVISSILLISSGGVRIDLDTTTP